MVPPSPLALVPSSPNTTSPGSKGSEASPAWCLSPRNPLFLRRRAPRPPDNWGSRRVGRGAPLPASPYSFVGEHHVPRTIGAGGGSGVVPPSPLALVPSSASTTSQSPRGPRQARRGASLPASPYSFVDEHHVPRTIGAAGGPDVVRLFLLALVPSSTSTTSPGPNAQRPAEPKKGRQPQVPLGLPPSPPIRKYPPLHSSRRVFPSLFSLASAAV